MLHLILWCLGLGWVLTHGAYVTLTLVVAAGTVFVLYTKGFMDCPRLVVFSILLAFQGVEGLALACLLHSRTPPPEPNTTCPY